MKKVRRPGEKAVARATAVIDALGLEEPEDLDIVMIAAAHRVFAATRPLAGEDGHVLRGGGVALATIATSTLQTPRWRWTLGHELGHVLLDGSRDDFARCTQNVAPEHLGRETRANDFTGEVLMPRRMFEPRWRAGAPTLARVGELARVFGTSVSATALRAVLFCDEPCAAICTTEGRVDWAAASVTGFGVEVKKGDVIGAGVGVREETVVEVGQRETVLRWWRRR